MGPPQRQQQDRARRQPGNACVWVVAALLLLAVLAGGGCLVLYLTLPPAEVLQWLPAAGLALVALPWAFWIFTCAYRCCCSANAAAEWAAVGNEVGRQPSSRAGALAPIPMPMPSSKSLDGSPAAGSPTASSGARRVRFGEATVLGEVHAATEKDDGSSVHSNESEAPLAYLMTYSTSRSTG